MDVDQEYRKLNEWYQKCDALRPWLDSTENISNAEVGNEITVTEVKEKLPTVQVILSFFASLKPLEGIATLELKKEEKYYLCSTHFFI